MKRFTMLAVAAILVVASALGAFAATEVKMTGDAMIYGNFWSGRNFTGWNNLNDTGNAAGTSREEAFNIWERFRLRSDFVANEAVKFRLGLRVQNTWGTGTLTAANPQAQVQVYQAYLQFKYPGSDVEITAGLQDFSLPGNAFFCDSVVFGGTRAAALTINAPIVEDVFSVVTGFSRMIDVNQTFDQANQGHQADELDLYFLVLPITVDGFKATPWGALAVVGRDTNLGIGTYGWSNTLMENVLAPGTGTINNGWRNKQNAYYWVGSTFEVTALDPVRFYADVIYGAGAMADRQANKRQGWFLDFGAEYTGLDMVTPQVFAWWASGEDGSTRNGSERMPTVVPNWGPGNNFLFDSSQEFTLDSNLGVNPVGAWGLGASLNNISFIEKLTHRLTFIYMRGTNSPTAIRDDNLRVGGAQNNNYFIMGRDLSYNESLISVSFDNTYQIYENLAFLVEAGWAHGNFQKSIWRTANGTNSLYNKRQDVVKVAFGLTYKF